MIIISSASPVSTELEYVLRYAFNTRLGLDWESQVDPSLKGYRVSVKDGPRIEFPEVFLNNQRVDWLRSSSLPNLPLQYIALPDELRKSNSALPPKLPVLYGSTEAVEVGDFLISLPWDLFGSIFFMLTRYEEAVLDDADEHGRFPFESSLLAEDNLIEKPIVDQMIELMWASLKWIEPNLKRKSCEYSVAVSCDVDVPYVPQVKSIAATCRMVLGDLLKRRSPLLAVRNLLNYLFTKVGIYVFDPNNSFAWIMQVNEALNRVVTFYFIAESSTDGKNGSYHLDELRIRALIREICSRGHIIGLHGGYDTFQNGAQFGVEVENLRRVLREEGIDQDYIPNRQHYLRWDSSVTPRILADNGVSFDSTVGFPEQAGFRAGTCHAYPMFDLLRREELEIVEIPLTVMETSIISTDYMSLGLSQEAFDCMLDIRETCRLYSGQFSLLWHNDSLETSTARKFYQKIINMDDLKR